MDKDARQPARRREGLITIIEIEAWKPFGYKTFAEAWGKEMDGVTIAAEIRAHAIYQMLNQGLTPLGVEQRPKLAEALAMIDNGQADGLIMRDLDRLAREITVQEAVIGRVWMLDHAAVFTSCGRRRCRATIPMTRCARPCGRWQAYSRGWSGCSSPSGCDGRRAKGAAGGHATGSPPFGYKSAKRSPGNLNGALVPVPAEQAALRRMRELRAAGASTHQIADALTAEVHPTKRGGRWASATVARILARDTAPAATE